MMFHQLNPPRPTWRHKLEKGTYLTGLRPAARLRLPAFLGIGAEKAGTSWLWANLRCHPALYLPQEKELHYFCCYFDRPLGSYSRQFEPAGERLAGEITPGYAEISRQRIGFLRRLAPKLKLIFLMRHPVERAWSQAYMNLVSEPGRRLEEVPEAAFLEHFQSARSRLRGDYLALLAPWQAAFPSQQLFLGFYDDLATRPRELLIDVFRFLGVSTEVDWQQFPVGQRVYPVLASGAQRSGAVERSVQLMPPGCEAALKRIYREPVAALIERFGPGIEHWRID
jgi:hypothetical protein